MRIRSLAIGLSLVSQTALAATPTTLPPVFVSGTRSAEHGLDMPAATTLIGRREIADSGARDLEELLRRVPGIHVADSIGDGGSANIDMRGFGATANSNVVILVNGRKINPATDSSTLYLNSIDLENVEQIEIIEGSAGILYGNQAVGGLINVITRRPDARSLNAKSGGGSYDGWELQGGITERLGQQVGLSVQATRRESDNYRERNASRMQRLDARLEVDHQGGFSYVDAQLLDDYVQTPGALFASELAADRRQAVFPNDYFDTTSQVLRIGTEQALGAHWRIEAELAVRDDQREFVQSFRGFPGTPSTQDRETIELTPRLIGRFGDNVWTLGADLQRTDYLLLTAFGPQGIAQDIAALYGQVMHPLSSRLSVTAGLRHAQVQNDINNGGIPVDLDDAVTVGSLGLVYRPEPAWRLFARADQNYRFAKVDEHTNVPFGQPVGLKNQRGVSYEAGAELTRNAYDLGVRAYRLDLEDEISFDAVTFSNVNLPRSRRLGFGLSADIAVSPTVQLGAGYDYIDSKITSGTHSGSSVPLVPVHKANLYAECRPQDDWLLRLDVAYVGEQYLGSDYTNTAPPLDAYTVADLSAHRDLGDWRLSARINNLFDARYSETGASSFAGNGYNPAPERNFWVEASYRFEE
ncbi:MAG: TonB-dependent receptor [Gammaproteobacteria bacterium]|nr:TonB-dependent receptor [Gammaproteobacteria bacterium]